MNSRHGAAVAKRSSQPAATRQRPRAARSAADSPVPARADTERGALLIVGVGASAGGFEAFKRFLEYLPGATGMAFVYIQHLDPARESLLVELLAPRSRIPVQVAEDGAAIEPARVYVMPPTAPLTGEGGRFHLVAPAPAREFRRPIDTFLTS